MRNIFDLPYLTAGIGGTGGRIKESPEDFVVEERPLYEPEGRGEHVFLWIEKRSISTFDVIRKLGEAIQAPPRNIAYAGLKDVKSVSRQYICVSGVSEEALSKLSFDDFRILDMKRHTNKLRMGHLEGNYFRIRVRGVAGGDVARAREILGVLEAKGVPNFYGPQRFGAEGRNVAVGRALLTERYHRAIQAFFAAAAAEEGSGVYEARQFACEGDYNRSLKLFPQSFVPERRLAIALRDNGLSIGNLPRKKPQMGRIVTAVPKRYLEFYVSALQAYLFNEVLKSRYDSLDRVFEGDFAWIHSKGCVFLVEDAAAEAPRAASLEISPSGPIFGYKVPYAKGQPGEIEWGVLRKAHLSPRDFHMRIGLKNKGVRRPMRVPLSEVSFDACEDGYTVGFTLPKGAYATIVLREMMKPDSWDALV